MLHEGEGPVRHQQGKVEVIQEREGSEEWVCY